MNSIPTLPDPEKIKHTLARARRNCQEMELAGIQLEEVIAKLDSRSVMPKARLRQRKASACAERLRQREILIQRKQRLRKALEQGQS